MRKVLLALAAVLIPVAAAAQPEDGTLPSRALLLADDPMDHVGDFLPAEIASTIEEGRIWTGHLAPPGQFDAAFTARARPAADGTCRRTVHQFLLGEAPNGQSRIVRRGEPRELVAVGYEAADGGCNAITGFVPSDDRYAKRQLYGLRTIVDIFRAAKNDEIGPKQVDCRMDEGACPDALATLAAFDPQDVSLVAVRSLEKDCKPAEGRTRLCVARTIEEGDPFVLEVRLPDEDGLKTWKLNWEVRNGEPLSLVMLRTLII